MTDAYRNTFLDKKVKEVEAAQRLSKAGGHGRAKALSAKQRTKIASKAAKARWAPPKSGIY